MVREYKKSRYFIVLLLTLAVFVIGVLIGVVISRERATYIQDENRIQRLNYDSLQLQYFYIQNILSNAKDCSVASKTLEEQISNLALLGDRLEGFIRGTSANVKELNFLKREYTLAELRYWLFLNDVREICNDDNVYILYFYSNADCDECRTQGVILSFLKDNFRERLLVFALDSDFKDEPLLSIIKNSFNVTISPTLVINDEKHEGLIEKGKLLNIICSKYKDNREIKECNNS